MVSLTTPLGIQRDAPPQGGGRPVTPPLFSFSFISGGVFVFRSWLRGPQGLGREAEDRARREREREETPQGAPGAHEGSVQMAEGGGCGKTLRMGRRFFGGV